MCTVPTRIFLAQPHYGAIDPGAARGFHAWASRRDGVEVIFADAGGSLLARTFNTLWVHAMASAEKGLITHFAMLHSDIQPGQFWLDTLLEEMASTKADIVSAVVPIRDKRGLTTTAIDNPASRWQPERRLTMHEVMQLPETFSAHDLAVAGLNPHNHGLLVNTGCWICSMIRPWVLGDWTQNKPLQFTINDRVYKLPNGQWGVDVESEDWYFSREAARWGANIVATRKVTIGHIGQHTYSNESAWGTWTYDEDTLPKPEAESVEAEPPADFVTDLTEGEPTHG
jgi:hypothetical protein